MTTITQQISLKNNQKDIQTGIKIGDKVFLKASLGGIKENVLFEIVGFDKYDLKVRVIKTADKRYKLNKIYSGMNNKFILYNEKGEYFI